MIKDKLSPLLQPSEVVACAVDSLDLEVFPLPTASELVTSEGCLDTSHSEVQVFYSFLGQVMCQYVALGSNWDLTEVIHNAAGKATENIVLSEGEIVRGVLNVVRKDTYQLPVMEINGIVMDESLRGKGLASWLLNYAVERHQPGIVNGDTNSEVAALSRALILGRLGFVTYAGGLPIYKPEQRTNQISFVTFFDWLSYLNYFIIDPTQVLTHSAPYPDFKKTDRVKHKPDFLSPPEWQNLKQVFDTVVEEQDNDPTALIQVPLVSIK